uniref:CCDC113/CCDC96 coiled-coil domain-containing protein n=1 Tax=Aquila chrysaetos chrysaetos TaxID=223781 RepID=A0A663DK34_AQUCH
MEEAAAGPEPEPEPTEGPAGLGEPSPGAPGESPGPEVLDGPGEPAEPRPEEPPEPCKPEEPGLEEPEPCEPEEPGPEQQQPGPCGPEGPEEPGSREPEPCGPEEPGPEKPEPCELEGPEEPGPGEPEEPGPEEPGPGEPEGPEEPSEPSDPGPSAAAAAAGGAGEAEAGGPAGEAREAAEEGEEERRERAALLEQHGGLAAERERLRRAGARLQLRLGELLRLRRGERRPRAEPGAGGPELYAQRLLRLRELREERERAAAACRERVAARRRDGEERQARARAEWAAFQARKKEAAVSSLGRRLGGREAAAAAVARIQAGEGDKERQARVENIKLKHEIQNLETILKAQGELVEGQRFLDFEHMKKENQKHSKKIDDLSDEILKLKKKVSNTVHVLSQFREKLQFVEAENQGRKAELMDIESVLSQKRDVLTKTKQARDRLRRNNLKLQQKCGLLGNEALLRDFEEKVDAAELLSQRLETLKRHHAALILTCRGIQKKIKEANSSFLAEDD